MPAASRNLNTILAQEHIAAKQWDKVRQIARELSVCLQTCTAKTRCTGA